MAFAPGRALPQPAARLLRAIGYCGAGFVTIFHLIVYAVAVPRVLASAHPTDFFIFLRSVEHLLRGVPDLNDEWYGPNLNHPATTIFFVPLSALHPHTAYWLWTLIGWLAAGAAFALVMREVGLFGRDRRAAAGLIVAILPGYLASALVGQVGAIFALLLVVAWLLLRRDRTLPAALLLGALGMLKPFLLLAVLTFLVLRQWRALVAFGGGALAIAFLPLPFQGLDGYRTWLVLLDGVDYFRSGWNVSLAGTLTRLLGFTPPGLVWSLSLLSGVVALALLEWGRRSGRLAPGDGLALVLPLALLGSPLGWLYYLAFALPALALLIQRWRAVPVGWRAAIVVLAGIVCATDLLNFLPLPLGGTLLNAPTLLLIALIGALVAVRQRGGAPTRVPVAPASLAPASGALVAER